jgi:hypothetical protein
MTGWFNSGSTGNLGFSRFLKTVCRVEQDTAQHPAKVGLEIFKKVKN